MVGRSSPTDLLFVREQRRVDGRPGSATEPFCCLGFARYESHQGERPMAIRWRLERGRSARHGGGPGQPRPADHYQASRRRSATLAKA